ncbi:MAG: hypothetical protein KC620_24915 [Myxococcales bacterium]|nr:hypothetical protein [Myxococcales bacterium]
MHIRGWVALGLGAAGIVGCGGEEGDEQPIAVIDAGPGEGLDSSPYFPPGPAFRSRCDGPAPGPVDRPIVDPQPVLFDFGDPPFYVRVVHLQNYGTAPLIIDDYRLDATPAFAAYFSEPGRDATLAMTGGHAWLPTPICVPPGEGLEAFIRVNSIPGELTDGLLTLQTNRPTQPVIELPIECCGRRPE